MQRIKSYFNSLKHRKIKGISLGQVPTILYVVMIIGGFVGATYIMLESFQNSTDNTSKAYEGIGLVLDFVDNIVTNLPVVGTIIFVVLLVGAIMWLRQRSGRGGA